MAESTTLARPYAQAVFELAKAKKKFPEWSQTLADLLSLIRHEPIAKVISSVKVSKQQLIGLLRELCGSGIDEQGKNLLSLLVENGRLGLLDHISAVYEVLRAEAESVIEAEVITAFPLDKAQSAGMTKALKAKLGRNIKIVSKIDKSIIGGAIIRAGDMVIDGSVSGRIIKLGRAINI